MSTIVPRLLCHSRSRPVDAFVPPRPRQTELKQRVTRAGGAPVSAAPPSLLASSSSSSSSSSSASSSATSTSLPDLTFWAADHGTADRLAVITITDIDGRIVKTVRLHSVHVDRARSIDQATLRRLQDATALMKWQHGDKVRERERERENLNGRSSLTRCPLHRSTTCATPSASWLIGKWALARADINSAKACAKWCSRAQSARARRL